MVDRSLQFRKMALVGVVADFDLDVEIISLEEDCIRLLALAYPALTPKTTPFGPQRGPLAAPRLSCLASKTMRRVCLDHLHSAATCLSGVDPPRRPPRSGNDDTRRTKERDWRTARLLGSSTAEYIKWLIDYGFTGRCFSISSLSTTMSILMLHPIAANALTVC